LAVLHGFLIVIVRSPLAIMRPAAEGFLRTALAGKVIQNAAPGSTSPLCIFPKHSVHVSNCQRIYANIHAFNTGLCVVTRILPIGLALHASAA